MRSGQSQHQKGRPGDGAGRGFRQLCPHRLARHLSACFQPGGSLVPGPWSTTAANLAASSAKTLKSMHKAVQGSFVGIQHRRQLMQRCHRAGQHLPMGIMGRRRRRRFDWPPISPAPCMPASMPGPGQGPLRFPCLKCCPCSAAPDAPLLFNRQKQL